MSGSKNFKTIPLIHVLYLDFFICGEGVLHGWVGLWILAVPSEMDGVPRFYDAYVLTLAVEACKIIQRSIRMTTAEN